MREIYFDNAATTQVSDEVVTAIVDMMKSEYGNPSSLHTRGVAAERRYMQAGRQVLSALGAREGQVVFTSGGTESNNLAVMGAAAAHKRRGNRIVTTTVEHASVGACCDELESRGFDVVRVAPGKGGVVDAAQVLAACNADTILVTMMLVNNEVGTIQPVEQVAHGLHRVAPNALLHTDAVQAFGKIVLSASKLGVNLLSVSGHKFHAPKGVGALYVAPGTRILPVLYGSGQQRGLRPGTEGVPLSVGMGVAAERAVACLAHNMNCADAVRTRLIERLSAMGIQINSPAKEGSPFLLNVSVLGYRSETLLHFLAGKGIYVSSGSACSKGAASPVLKAMGLSPASIDSALRISLCDQNTPDEADALADALAEAMHQLKRT